MYFRLLQKTIISTENVTHVAMPLRFREKKRPYQAFFSLYCSSIVVNMSYVAYTTAVMLV